MAPGARPQAQRFLVIVMSLIRLSGAEARTPTSPRSLPSRSLRELRRRGWHGRPWSRDLVGGVVCEAIPGEQGVQVGPHGRRRRLHGHGHLLVAAGELLGDAGRELGGEDVAGEAVAGAGAVV